MSEITTPEALDALPVGSVVEATWFTWADSTRPWGNTRTVPVSRLFMVTEHMLIAERYEVAKRGPYSALARFDGGIRVVSRPDALARAKAEALREAAAAYTNHEDDHGAAMVARRWLRARADRIDPTEGTRG